MLALPFMILGFYGREFAPVIAIGWTFTPGVIALYCALSVMVVFSQTGRPIVKSYIRALGLVVSLALFFPLLPAAGALGGAIAVSAGYVAMLLISVILASRHLNVPLIDLVVPKAEDLPQVREAIQIGRRYSHRIHAQIESSLRRAPPWFLSAFGAGGGGTAWLKS